MIVLKQFLEKNLYIFEFFTKVKLTKKLTIYNPHIKTYLNYFQK